MKSSQAPVRHAAIFAATQPILDNHFMEWMLETQAAMREKGLTWQSCRFRTEENGDFHYTEEWE